VLGLAAFNLFFRLGREGVTEWDESLYAITAAEIVACGHWIGTTFMGALDYYNTKPPLNVWLIALSFKAFGSNLVSLRLPSIVAAWLTVAILQVWARRTLGSVVALLSSLVLSTTFGFIYDHAGRSANTDALFTLLVLLAIVTCWAARERPWRLAWLGPLTAAVFLLGLAVVLLPVAVRNSVVDRGFYLTTSQFGPNFYIGNNARADGTYMSLRFGRGTPEYERQDATELAEDATGRRLTPAEVSSYWTTQTLAFIRSEPLAWSKLLGRKTALLWNRSEMLDTESQESYAEWSTLLRLAGRLGHFGVLVPLACLGIIITWPSRNRLWVIYGISTAYAASVVMFYVSARYRYPLVPFLLLFAAAGLVALPRLRRANTRQSPLPRRESHPWAG